MILNNKSKGFLIQSFLLGLFIVFSSWIYSEGFSNQETIQLIAKTDNNIAPNQYESYMTMRNVKPGRQPVQNKFHAYRKDDKMAVVFIAPISQKGQAFIRNGDDMWMYLPKSEKVMRINAKDNSMGGEASNADILRGNLAEDYNSSFLMNETINGTNCYKLELKAKRRTVAYDRIVYWISVEGELPIQREYYSISGKKLKTMYFSDVKTLGGQQRPTLIVIVNEQNINYKTEVITEDMNANVDLDNSMFNQSYFKRLH